MNYINKCPKCGADRPLNESACGFCGNTLNPVRQAHAPLDNNVTTPAIPKDPFMVMFQIGLTLFILGFLTVGYNLLFANIGVPVPGQNEYVVNTGKMADRTVWTNAGCAYMIVGAIFIAGSRRR